MSVPFLRLGVPPVGVACRFLATTLSSPPGFEREALEDDWSVLSAAAVAILA